MAARRLAEASAKREQAESFARTRPMSHRMRRAWSRDAAGWAQAETEAAETFQQLAGPDLNRLDDTIRHFTGTVDTLRDLADDRSRWLDAHREAVGRLDGLERQLRHLDLEHHLAPRLAQAIDQAVRPSQLAAEPAPDHELDIGL